MEKSVKKYTTRDINKMIWSYNTQLIFIIICAIILFVGFLFITYLTYIGPKTVKNFE
jgi:hypothetical protein